MEIGKKLNPQTPCSMAEQIYPLTFEDKEFIPGMLGGSGGTQYASVRIHLK